MRNTLDLTQDAVYNMVVNANRTLFAVINCFLDNTTAFDFSQYTGAVLQVRNNKGVVVLEFTTTDNSIQILHGEGKFKLQKSAEAMNVREGDYVYDMVLTSSTVPQRAFLSGSFKINSTVTKI